MDMDMYAVLAGPTLDKALGLARLGKLTVSAANIPPVEALTCASTAGDLAKLRDALPDGLKALVTPADGNPVHLYVTSRRAMYTSREVHHHLLATPLPPSSLASLGHNILVPTWELYYVLRCRKEARLSKRLMLGMELCGTYTHQCISDESSTTYYRQPSQEKDGKLFSRWDDPRIESATSVQKLDEYLCSAAGIRGIARTREALRLLKDGSASPFESLFAIMASLPCRLGGYGFTNVELNPKVDVPEEKRRLTRAKAYHPDCYLRTMNLDLEVESRERHSSSRAVERDKARRNDIQALGIEVKDVTWDMISRFDNLELLFEQVLQKEKDVGLDVRGAHARLVRKPEFVARRRALLQELLPDWPCEG